MMEGGVATEAATKRREGAAVEEGFAMIPIEGILESGTNPRKTFEPKALADLAASIKEKGVLQPILVRWKPREKVGSAEISEHFEIVAGARRFRAAKKAGLTEIPAVVRQLTDDQALEAQVIENLQRADVHPLEEADGYAALIARGNRDVEAIAQKVGKSASYIYQRLKLTELIEPAKQAFLKEEITAGHAILLARLNAVDQKAALEICLEESQVYIQGMPAKESDNLKSLLPVRALQRWIESYVHTDLNKAPWKMDDAQLVPVAGACTTCPRRSGTCPSLFPEVEKASVCMDRMCYQTKLHRWFDLKLKSIEGGGFKAVLVSTLDQWNVPKEERQESILYHGKWTAAGKKKCDHLAKGVYVDGKSRGSVVDVCTSATCRPHTGYQPPAGSKSSMSPEQRKESKEKEEADQRKQERERELEVALYRAAIEKAPDKIGPFELQIVAQALAHGDQPPDELYAALGWKDGHFGLFDKLKRLKGRQLLQYVLGHSLCSYDRVDYQLLQQACKQWKVPVDKIKAELKKKWAVEDEVEEIVEVDAQAKKSKRSKPKGEKK